MRKSKNKSNAIPVRSPSSDDITAVLYLVLSVIVIVSPVLYWVPCHSTTVLMGTVASTFVTPSSKATKPEIHGTSQNKKMWKMTKPKALKWFGCHSYHVIVILKEQRMSVAGFRRDITAALNCLTSSNIWGMTTVNDEMIDQGVLSGYTYLSVCWIQREYKPVHNTHCPLVLC